MDIFILIDTDGGVKQSTSTPLLSADSYPTVVKVSGYGDRGYCDDYDVEVFGVNGWEDVKELANE